MLFRSDLARIRQLLYDGKQKKGHKFVSIQITWKVDSVLVILKKDSPKEPKIAFIEAKDIEDALWCMAQAISSKKVAWKTDKWRTMRIDE